MKYNTYLEYKETNSSGFNKIPKHWIIVPIKFNLSIPITDGPHETPILYNEGIPFISAEAVKNDKLNFNLKRGFIDLGTHERYCKKYKPQIGDVYMVKSGATTGNVARVETNEEFNIWSPLAALRPDKSHILTDFLFFFMKSKSFFHSVELNWSYGTQQNIGMNVIANLRMTRPPLEEQKSIANFLTFKTKQIDELIEKKKELIKKLNEKKIALITHVVTKGLDKSAPMKDSDVDWIGKTPKHWELRKLKFLVELKNNKINAIDTDLDYMGLENVEPFSGKKIVMPEGNIESEGVGTCYSKNDVLFGKLRPYLAKAYLAEEEGICSTEFLVMTPIDINSSYLLRVVLSKGFIDLTNSSTYGAKMPRANWDFIGQLLCPVPTMNEQIEIASFIRNEISRIDDIIVTNEKLVLRLAEYRAAIINSAVIGKIDVIDFKIPEGTV